MIKKSIKFTLSTAAAITLTLLLLFTAAVLWVLTGPRSITFLTPYLENSLEYYIPGVRIDVESTMLRWDGWAQAFNVHATHVTLYDKEDKEILEFPDIQIDFGIIGLLRGNGIISSLTLIQPRFYLRLYEQQEEAEKTEAPQNKMGALLAFLISKTNIYLLKKIEITDGLLMIENGGKEVVWQIRKLRVNGRDQEQKDILAMTATVDLGGRETALYLETVVPERGVPEVVLRFENFPSVVFSQIMPENPFFALLDVAVNGTFTLLLGDDGVPYVAELAVSDVKGKILAGEYFEEDIPITQLAATARLTENFTKLELKNLTLRDNGAELSLKGVSEKTSLNAAFPKGEIYAEVKGLSVNHLRRFWPVKLGPKVRQWVIEHVRNGRVTHAAATFSFQPEDFIARAEGLPLRKETIKAEIIVENASVSYHPDFPNIDDLYGTVYFTGNTMDIAVTGGKALHSGISEGTVEIADLWKRPAHLSIKGKAIGPAADLLRFIPPKSYEAPPELKESLSKMEGTATSEITLGIPLQKQLLPQGIALTLHSTLEGIAVARIIKNIDITQGKMDLNIQDKMLKLDGSTMFNGVPMEMSLEKGFEKPGLPLRYGIKGRISGQDFEKLTTHAAPLDIEDTKQIGVMIQGITAPDGATITGNIDMTAPGLVIPKIGLSKSPGENATLDFKIKMHEAEKIAEVSELSVKGKQLSINGKLRMHSDFSNIVHAQLPEIKYGKNDLALEYEAARTHDKLSLKGNMLDLSQVKFGTLLKRNGPEKDKGLEVSLALKTVLMKHEEELRDVALTLECKPKLCVTGNAYGKFASGDFIAASLTPTGDRVALLAESNNAGAVIRAFGISKNVQGGALNIQAASALNGGKAKTEGEIRISDFAAVKTPLLGKLLTLASLKGIGELLQGEGIKFKTLNMPFSMEEGIVTVHDARSSGSSVGITVEGQIDTTKAVLELNGTLVPASAVNRVLGNIPVFGALITGGKDEGLLAFTYTIKGPYDNAKVQVNPLSILAPGFLRKLFEIGQGRE